MKKVLFFTQNRWAFGTIHQGLIKELYKHGVYSSLLDYTVSYSKQEFDFFIDIYDYFVTNPETIPALMSYGVPLQKIIAVAHAEWDIYSAAKDFVHHNTNNYDIHAYGCISDKLVNMFNDLHPHSKIKAKRVANGIHFDLFYANPPNSLETVGFGGKMVGCNFFGVDIKRGDLVEKVTNLAGLQFLPNATYHYMAMPAYYKTIDAIIMASTEEAAGMPMLEAAAAGRLCIGTPVGYFNHNSDSGGGIKVRIDGDDFINDTVKILEHYKANPEKYKQKCLDIQEYARYNYDWKYVIDGWIELFN
jgi:glycosyltransferase involved in cell wall biosynthesis